MSRDIRRMSKTELDELNRVAKEWHARNTLDQSVWDAPAVPPEQDADEPKPQLPVQMDLL